MSMRIVTLIWISFPPPGILTTTADVLLHKLKFPIPSPISSPPPGILTTTADDEEEEDTSKISENILHKMLKSWDSGDLLPYLRSEPIPPPDPYDPTKVLVGSHFDKFLEKEKGKDVRN
jgi:hypothetical protein